MRKIIICMDGTGNEIGDHESNILKIYQCLDQTEDQMVYYVQGVGTSDSQMVMRKPWQKFKGLLGLAFGLGLEDDVLEAYRYLCRNYQSAEEKADHYSHHFPDQQPDEPFEDDRIYIMGFSRGAYAARVLAGFINNFGLVEENVLHLIAPVFRAYRGITEQDPDEPVDEVFKPLRQYEAVLRPNDRVPIRFLGLFDTVSSMIRFGWPLRNLRRYGSLFELSTHASVKVNPSVRIVSHALAIDEKRSFFRDMRWVQDRYFYGNRFRQDQDKRKQYVRQRWFAGYHSDIGGSEREDQANIGKITALWMLDSLREAEIAADLEDNEIRAERDQAPLPGGPDRAVGFQLRNGYREVRLEGGEYGHMKTKNPGGYRYSAPDPRGPLHPSIANGWRPRLSWAWAPLEILIKSIQRREKGPVAWFRHGIFYYLPLAEPRFIPDDTEVDDSVFIRRDDAGCKYNPGNLKRPTPKGLKD